VLGNLATTYEKIGRLDEGLRLLRDVYSGQLKLSGEEDSSTLKAASNFASSLVDLRRFEEARSVLRKSVPVARRSLGENDLITLTLRTHYAKALYEDASATLDDLRAAVTTLEDSARISKRVLGGKHPLTIAIEHNLEMARKALSARSV